MIDDALLRAIEAGAFADLEDAFKSNCRVCPDDVRIFRAAIERIGGLLGRPATVPDVLACFGCENSLIEFLAIETLKDPFAAPGVVRKRADVSFEKHFTSSRSSNLTFRR